MTTSIRALQEEDEMVNARGDDAHGEYIHEVKHGEYHINAQTSLQEGSSVDTVLHITGKEGNTLKSVKRETYVKNGTINEVFRIEEIIDQEKIDRSQIESFEGEIRWQK